MLKPTQSPNPSPSSNRILGVIVLFFVALLGGAVLFACAGVGGQPAIATDTKTKADMVLGAGASPAPTGANAGANAGANGGTSAGRYDMGNPTYTDIWVGPGGNDDRDSDPTRGQTQGNPLRSIAAAYRGIPVDGTTRLRDKAYRIRLLPGRYDGGFLSTPSGDESNLGTAETPILIESSDPTQRAQVIYNPSATRGNLQLFRASYVYLRDFEIRMDIDVNGQAVNAESASDGFQCEQCDHVLLRNMIIRSIRETNAQNETLKVNQSSFIFVEDSDIGGAGSSANALDFVAVQHAHIVGNRFHDTGDWCAYVKGGSAYILFEANEIDHCFTGGFTAGEGSSAQFMRAPYLHYEAYDVKFVNNLIHDVDGAAFGVNGAYNVLFAYNTAYRVGRRSHMIELEAGRRSCEEPSVCQPYLDQGGWGTADPNAGEQPYIPNKNIFIYNNIVLNPAGWVSDTIQVLHVRGPLAVPAGHTLGAGITQAQFDDGLVVRGNILWSGADSGHTFLGVGADGEGACLDAHPSCSASYLLANNAINTIEPQLANAAGGDWRPTPNGNVFGATTYAIPDFVWSDAPAAPNVPTGTLSNAVAQDRVGMIRIGNGIAGAYASANDNAPTLTTTPLPSPSPSPTGSTINLPLLTKASAATATAVPTSLPNTATPTTLPTLSATPLTPVPTATLPPGAVAIVTLGDSLTEGDQDTTFDAQEHVLGYPGRLVSQVQVLPSRSGSVLSNLGKSGWDSNALVSAGGPDGNGGMLTAQLPRAISNLQTQMASGKAGVACVLIGSNDLWYLYNEGYETNAEQEGENLTNYSNNIEAILSQLRATGAMVMIGLVDDQSLRPVAADPARRQAVFPNVSANEVAQMSAQAQRYNAVIRAKAAQHGAIVVDFYNTTIFTDPATIGEDGNHPNSAGYDAMAAVWMAAMRGRLGD